MKYTYTKTETVTAEINEGDIVAYNDFVGKVIRAYEEKVVLGNDFEIYTNDIRSALNQQTFQRLDGRNVGYVYNAIRSELGEWVPYWGRTSVKDRPNPLNYIVFRETHLNFIVEESLKYLGDTFAFFQNSLTEPEYVIIEGELYKK